VNHLGFLLHEVGINHFSNLFGGFFSAHLEVRYRYATGFQWIFSMFNHGEVFG